MRKARQKIQSSLYPREKGPGADCKAEPVSVPSTPVGVLELLKQVNCRSKEGLKRLRNCIEQASSVELAIGHTATRTHRVSYFFRLGGKYQDEMLPMPWAKDTQIAKDFCDDGNGMPAEILATNYFVLMDVETPKKSLWMVYRYKRVVADKPAVSIKQRLNIPLIWGNRRLGKGIGGFDIIRLLDNINDWKPTRAAMLDTARLDKLMGKGEPGQVWEPHFMTPIRKELEEAWQKGC
ncbi:hypothetical protein B0H63DRAFT_528960 [Podospora didyma]|uniref:Uncharacterized protein n=1 Tax=Podospora didyma TaxID=330526 RepID=A0AAE0K252_9PEZI|nr:hypothetical protein B0H63DRAFT_528960 [Podospora didyma]